MLGNSLAVGVDLNHFLQKTKYNYLEIGCYNGVNLAELSKNFPNKKIYGVDPFIGDGCTGQDQNSVLGEQKYNLYKNIDGCSNVIFYEKTNEQFLEEEKNNFKNMNISSIFIDGAHILKYIKTDVDISIECIRNNPDSSGLILFHDMHIPDVIQGIEYFKKRCEEENIRYVCNQQNEYYSEFEVII